MEWVAQLFWTVLSKSFQPEEYTRIFAKMYNIHLNSLSVRATILYVHIIFVSLSFFIYLYKLVTRKFLDTIFYNIFLLIYGIPWPDLYFSLIRKSLVRHHHNHHPYYHSHHHYHPRQCFHLSFLVLPDYRDFEIPEFANFFPSPNYCVWEAIQSSAIVSKDRENNVKLEDKGKFELSWDTSFIHLFCSFHSQFPANYYY